MEINLMRGEMFDEIRSVLSDLYGADAVASIAGGVKIKEQVSDIYFFTSCITHKFLNDISHENEDSFFNCSSVRIMMICPKN